MKQLLRLAALLLAAVCALPTAALATDEGAAISMDELTVASYTTLVEAAVTATTSGELTIRVNGSGAGEYAVFTVKDAEGSEVVTVAVQIGGSVTIAGLANGAQYTVTPQSGWSWRYTLSRPETATAEADGSAEAVFTAEKTQSAWLDDEAAYSYSLSD